MVFVNPKLGNVNVLMVTLALNVKRKAVINHVLITVNVTIIMENAFVKKVG